MADSVGFVNMIKRVALAAVKASKPAEVCFGRVTEESPLKILVDQKLTLGKVWVGCSSVSKSCAKNPATDGIIRSYPIQYIFALPAAAEGRLRHRQPARYGR